MRPTLLIHVLAGTLGLAAGYLALWSAKGAPLHRRSGVLFVYAMLVMCVAGTTIAAVSGVAPYLNVPAGVLTAYLVITALTTVRPRSALVRRAEPALALVALGVGAACLWFGVEAASSPDGRGRDGMPGFPFFLFGVVGTLAGVLDLRMMRAGGLSGAPRLVRHLWRMSFALFVAAMSFFIGQADVFPRPIRIRPLLAMPVLAVLVTMGYWLWRVRIRRSLRGTMVAAAAKA